MKFLRSAFIVTMIFSGLGSCTKPLVCTMELRHILVTVQDENGNRVIPKDYKAVMVRTNEDITIKEDSATVILTSDAKIEKFNKKGDDVRFTVFLDTESIERVFKVGTDGCHVELKAGNTVFVVK